jgi:predicted metal-dependent phosphoesterase TrpH
MDQDAVPLPSAPPLVRADLHVHSCHSLRSGNFRFLRSRDCYSRPEDVYRAAKSRGMDVVTITDHDSIGGCLEFLDRHPGADDFFVSEEVSCWFPDAPIEVHFGVYGMTEALHRDLQPLRRNALDVAARLREAGVVFALNHLLHFYRGQIPFESYLRLLDAVPALEVRNGTMLPSHNALIEHIVEQSASANRLGMIAGSDAHTLRRVGTTWTSAPGPTRDEFMSSLRAGLGRPGGVHGGASTVAGDAYGVISSYMASLVGFGPRDVTGWKRVGCLAFVAGSLPGQIVFPMAVASARKAGERRAVRRAVEYLSAPAVRMQMRESGKESGA